MVIPYQTVAYREQEPEVMQEEARQAIRICWRTQGAEVVLVLKPLGTESSKPWEPSSDIGIILFVHPFAKCL